MAAPKAKIVHLSGDFPDKVDPDKTRALKSLVESTLDTFDHSVISINRKSPRPAAALRVWATRPPDFEHFIRSLPFEYGECLTYTAPPRGIFHATMLRKLGDWLVRRLQQPDCMATPPALLVAHKLTIEGIPVRLAAETLGIPYALCLQGGTDQKIMAARPDLNGLWSDIFHGAAMVFPFAPWTLDWIENRVGKRTGPTVMLPCATELDGRLPPTSGGDNILTVFHLKSYRRKNLTGLADAVRLLRKEGRSTRIDIVGGGSEQEAAKARASIPDSAGVEFVGPITRDDLPARLNRAKGFALASHRESFGLVFLEALFAGLPIVYPKGSAVDGYFDGYGFAVPVDATDPRSIARGIAILEDEELTLKEELAAWQTSEHAARFTREHIFAQFSEGLQIPLSGSLRRMP